LHRPAPSATLAAMKGYSGLLIVSGFSLDFLLVVVVGPLAGGRGRPLELVRGADDATPRGPDDAEAATVLATMTLAGADRLEGKRARFLVVLDGPITMQGNFTLNEIVGGGANDLGTVWLVPGQDAGHGMIVEARLVVLTARRERRRAESVYRSSRSTD
jgi:hypothetical protein